MAWRHDDGLLCVSLQWNGLLSCSWWWQSTQSNYTSQLKNKACSLHTAITGQRLFLSGKMAYVILERQSQTEVVVLKFNRKGPKRVKYACYLPIRKLFLQESRVVEQSVKQLPGCYVGSMPGKVRSTFQCWIVAHFTQLGEWLANASHLLSIPRPEEKLMTISKLKLSESP